jgi:PilZ domain
MTTSRNDRRLVERHKIRMPLRIRLWKSAVPEHAAECVNLSQRGIYFATDSKLSEGETVEVFFNMPEEVVGEATSEWRCTGHIVRVEEPRAADGKLGVGVQFDCYEVAKSKASDVAIGSEMPIRRMLSDVAPNGERIPPWKNAQ